MIGKEVTLQDVLDKNLYQQIVYFKSDKYPLLQDKYWFITAALHDKKENNVLISFYNENEEGKWLNINVSPEESVCLMQFDIERCEGEDFDSAREEAILAFNKLVNQIVNKFDGVNKPE